MKTNLTKKVVMATAITAIATTMCFALAGCGDKTKNKSEYKFGEYAYSTLEKFDSIFMNRQAGTGAEVVASKWLVSEATSLGYEVEVVQFTYNGSKKITKFDF